MLVLDHDTLLISTFWKGLHSGFVVYLWLAHNHNTTGKVEPVNDSTSLSHTSCALSLVSVTGQPSCRLGVASVPLGLARLLRIGWGA